MSPPEFKIHVAAKKIFCSPNGGDGQFPHRTQLTWEGGHDDPFTLDFFIDGSNKRTRKWPFRENPTTPPSTVTTPFTGTLADVPAQTRFAYSISKQGNDTLDPIIIVDKT